MALFGRNATDVVPDEPHEPELVPVPVAEPIRRSLQEQRAFLLDRVKPVRPTALPIGEVTGLELCEDISADLDLPLVTTARIAGWGVRGSDLIGARPGEPRRLFLIDSVSVSDGFGLPLVEGATVAIEKGAIVPDGVDSVIPSAQGVVAADGYVDIESDARLYENLRAAGSELSDGTPLMRAGETLTPRSVAVLAEVGLDKVLARRRPRVVVFTVGDTLVVPGLPLTSAHQRYDAAAALVAGAARADHASVDSLGIVESTLDAVRQALTEQAGADLILAVGGGDLVREAAADLGVVDDAAVAFNGETRVGHVTLGGRRSSLLILPAGVVSAYVSYHALVRPMLGKLSAADPSGAPRVEGWLAHELPSAEGTTDFIPAVRDADGGIRAVTQTDSELAWDLARANVLAIIPESWGGAASGSQLECIVLDDAGATAGGR